VGESRYGLQEWGPAVRFTVEPQVARELLDRPRPPPPVSVTDLLDPRRAFWRRRFDVAAPADRRARMAEGQRLHRRVARLWAPAAQQEVRVVRDGIVGQIDLIQDVPVEVKGTGQSVDVGSLTTRHAAYVDQLGAYCALLERDSGRLVVVHLSEDRTSTDALVVECRYRDLARVREGLAQRASRLREAWQTATAAGLPGCPWRGRGCEYERQAVCDCDGRQAELAPLVPAAEVEITADPSASSRLATLLRTRWEEDPAVGRYRELLYPRRAYFERTRPPPEDDALAVVERAPATEDLFRELSVRLESGAPGEVTRQGPPHPLVDEPVVCFRGDPYLLKVYRGARLPPPERLIDAQPQYFLELGLRSASLGRAAGWLFLGHDAAARPEDRLVVLRVEFQPFELMVGQLETRAAELARALREAAPASLPPCPGWMVEGCAYRELCGCGETPAAASRLQR
jgi:hypothetical protein